MKKTALFLALILNFSIAYNQNSVEVTVQFGYTPVDVEEIVEKDEIRGTEAEDWGQGNGGISAQISFGVAENIGLGFEFNFHHLYWYSVHVPYGQYGLYREYSINTVKLIPFIRLGMESPFSLDIGPELNFIDGDAEIGLLFSANYYIGLTEKIDLPLKIRFEVIKYYLQTLFPISMHAGLRYKF